MNHTRNSILDIGYLLPPRQPVKLTASEDKAEGNSISGCFVAVATTVMPSRTAPKNPHIETASAAPSEPLNSEQKKSLEKGV
jgi:hypothetical protein